MINDSSVLFKLFKGEDEGGLQRLHLIRVRSRCRVALPLTRSIPDFLGYLVALFLKRQCNGALLHLLPPPSLHERPAPLLGHAGLAVRPRRRRRRRGVRVCPIVVLAGAPVPIHGEGGVDSAGDAGTPDEPVPPRESLRLPEVHCPGGGGAEPAVLAR